MLIVYYNYIIKFLTARKTNLILWIFSLFHSYLTYPLQSLQFRLFIYKQMKIVDYKSND